MRMEKISYSIFRKATQFEIEVQLARSSTELREIGFRTLWSGSPFQNKRRAQRQPKSSRHGNTRHSMKFYITAGKKGEK
jgi:hypothetical protein